MIFEKLTKNGVVHKSNQSKFFFIYNRDINVKYNLALTVCKKCKKTEEINLNSFSKIFQNLKTKKNTIFLILKWKYQLYVKSVLDYEKFKRFKEKNKIKLT